ncbi:MAG: hypothetical protein IMW93_08565, partial [Thermoanaerobacteraceae bacterium]|nr:hypothetical protein [Thermoanaerobacteraceae bacterium]
MSIWNRFTGRRGEEDLPGKLQDRKLWLLGGLVALGVALLLLGSVSPPVKQPPVQNNASPSTQEVRTQAPEGSAMARQEASLEEKLRQMLGQVEGAGRVEVTVRLASSSREEFAVNTTTSKKTTQEKDQAGGTRITSEDTDTDQLVVVRDGRGEMPVATREEAARVAGVLVVADGARDPGVKARLFQAVQVALGIEPQKILVLPRERGD